MRYGDGNRRDLRISRALGLRLVFQPPLMLLSWRRLRKSCTYVCSWSDHAGSDGELRNGRLLIDMFFLKSHFRFRNRKAIGLVVAQHSSIG
jgi:hypothetical protein